MITRRGFSASALGLAACASGARAHVSDAVEVEALYPDVERYVGFGPKRTASAADCAISEWLAREAETVGAHVRLQSFAVRQFDIERASLSMSGRSLETLPFWFPKPSDGVIEAPMRSLDEVRAGEIAFASLPSGLAGLRAMPEAVAQASHRRAAGLVMSTPTPSGHLFAHGQTEPCAVPALLVGGRDSAALQAAAAEGVSVRFELSGAAREYAEAFNVMATLGEGERLIGVSTPTSAWLSSGGERGPGVALWLALLRRAARMRGTRWMFLAASGHELDAAGGRAFVASTEAPAPSDVTAWCHLGASIATRRFSFGPGYEPIAHEEASGAARLITNEARLQSTLTGPFAGSAHTPQLSTTSDSRGELRLYMERGYPTFGFEGAHSYFHTPADLAQTTSQALLAETYRRLAQTFAALGA